MYSGQAGADGRLWVHEQFRHPGHASRRAAPARLAALRGRRLDLARHHRRRPGCADPHAVPLRAARPLRPRARAPLPRRRLRGRRPHLAGGRQPRRALAPHPLRRRRRALAGLPVRRRGAGRAGLLRPPRGGRAAPGRAGHRRRRVPGGPVPAGAGLRAAAGGTLVRRHPPARLPHPGLHALPRGRRDRRHLVVHAAAVGRAERADRGDAVRRRRRPRLRPGRGPRRAPGRLRPDLADGGRRHGAAGDVRRRDPRHRERRHRLVPVAGARPRPGRGRGPRRRRRPARTAPPRAAGGGGGARGRHPAGSLDHRCRRRRRPARRLAARRGVRRGVRPARRRPRGARHGARPPGAHRDGDGRARRVHDLPELRGLRADRHRSLGTGFLFDRARRELAHALDTDTTEGADR
jgi:hypothetical protein